MSAFWGVMWDSPRKWHLCDKNWKLKKRFRGKKALWQKERMVLGYLKKTPTNISGQDCFYLLLNRISFSQLFYEEAEAPNAMPGWWKNVTLWKTWRSWSIRTRIRPRRLVLLRRTMELVEDSENCPKIGHKSKTYENSRNVNISQNKIAFKTFFLPFRKVQSFFWDRRFDRPGDRGTRGWRDQIPSKNGDRLETCHCGPQAIGWDLEKSWWTWRSWWIRKNCVFFLQHVETTQKRWKKTRFPLTYFLWTFFAALKNVLLSVFHFPQTAASSAGMWFGIWSTTSRCFLQRCQAPKRLTRATRMTKQWG